MMLLRQMSQQSDSLPSRNANSSSAVTNGIHPPPPTRASPSDNGDFSSRASSLGLEETTPDPGINGNEDVNGEGSPIPGRQGPPINDINNHMGGINVHPGSPSHLRTTTDPAPTVENGAPEGAQPRVTGQVGFSPNIVPP
jgi:hypothetical protein